MNPSIHFLFPDQHRFDWLGINKELLIKTPHLGLLIKNVTDLTL